jgi:phosphatidyl-myo-inositol dimannoside synthase
MKILFITHKIGPHSGWERYSQDLIDSLKKYNDTVVIVSHPLLPDPLRFKRNYIGALWYVAKILRLWKSIKDVDVIHCTVEPYAFIAAMLSCILRKKLVITIHGSYAIKTLINPLYRRLQFFAYRRAHSIISISAFTHSRLSKYYFGNNVVVIPNGVSALSILSQPKVKPVTASILSVGALKRRKGYHHMISIIAKAKEQISNLHYHIVGNQSDTEYVKEIKSLIEKNNLQEAISIHSGISNEALNKLYMQASVFMLLPISDEYNFEGFGLVYLEANARGLPVIGSLESGAEAAINHGENGFLVDPTDYAKACETLISLLNDEKLYSMMTHKALAFATSHTWDVIGKRYREVYNQKP